MVRAVSVKETKLHYFESKRRRGNRFHFIIFNLYASALAWHEILRRGRLFLGNSDSDNLAVSRIVRSE